MSALPMSPGAALLRKSKVFAIPKPLSWKPEANTDGIGISKTATTPYPTHLSLATPLKSLSRGDWGLKRPLPLLTTTRTSSPSVRVQHIDTVEQVTGFQSSADHAINLLKWQELSLPLTVTAGSVGESMFLRKSVFDKDLDTLHETEESPARETIKWKFKGPWLAGFNDGEFSEFFRFQVQGRRAEFRRFLRSEYARSKTSEALSKSIASGSPSEELVTYQASDISDEELAAYIKWLRHEKRQLYRIIRTFLDLPPASVDEKGSSALTVDEVFFSTESKSIVEAIDRFTHPYANSGPPKSHPSAGLSYLRTTAFTFNHLLYGPQASKSPFEARILVPKNVQGSKARRALVGCAGFVSDIPTSAEPQYRNYKRGFKDVITIAPNLMSRIPGLSFLDPEAEGGSKTWIQPVYAQVNSKGGVELNWEMATPMAIAVRTNTVHKLKFEKDERFWKNISFSRSAKNKESSAYNIDDSYSALKKPARLSSAREYGLDSLVFSRSKPSEIAPVNDEETKSELDSLMDDYE